MPPEIDDLMWKLAESDDSAALEEFGQRYPQYRAEMAQRLRMVRNLKGARPSAKADRFVPKAEVAPYVEPAPKWMVPAAVAMVLASVVFATYALTTFLQGNKPQTPTVVATQPRPVEQAPAPITQPAPVQPQPQIPTPAPAQEPIAFTRKVTVIGTDVSLIQILQSIASQAGIELEIPPGMADQRINCDYREQASLLVIKDMGKNFGFTAFPQGEKNVLLIPARGRNLETEAPRPAGQSTPAAADETASPSN